MQRPNFPHGIKIVYILILIHTKYEKSVIFFFKGPSHSISTNLYQTVEVPVDGKSQLSDFGMGLLCFTEIKNIFSPKKWFYLLALVPEF